MFSFIIIDRNLMKSVSGMISPQKWFGCWDTHGLDRVHHTFSGCCGYPLTFKCWSWCFLRRKFPLKTHGSISTHPSQTAKPTAGHRTNSKLFWRMVGQWSLYVDLGVFDFWCMLQHNQEGVLLFKQSYLYILYIYIYKVTYIIQFQESTHWDYYANFTVIDVPLELFTY